MFGGTETSATLRVKDWYVSPAVQYLENNHIEATVWPGCFRGLTARAWVVVVVVKSMKRRLVWV